MKALARPKHKSSPGTDSKESSTRDNYTSGKNRTSDKFDREIEDYRFGVDALREAEKIKGEIRKWEHDVWNY